MYSGSVRCASFHNVAAALSEVGSLFTFEKVRVWHRNHAKLIRKFREIIDPLIPKDMFRLVCLVKLVFFAREGVAF